MNKLAALILMILLSGCSGLAPHYDFNPVAPRVMPLAEPVDPGPRHSGTIYRDGRDMRVFEDRTARRVGDIVVIRLVENTNASKSATTKTEKNSEMGLTSPSFFGPPLTSGTVTLETDLQGKRKISGDGSSDQSNSLTGNISAVVVGVYPNGNLAIRGEKMLTLNQGEEMVQISGVIRPEDILQNNVILSSQVADAKITYAGNGVLADTNTPGWLSRFFLSPLWPF